MNELLINKYKPKKISDCYFDVNTMIILENFIANNNYNFIVQGDSGCGKSSVINILINNYYNLKLVYSTHSTKAILLIPTHPLKWAQ